jgi:hypothetical protein
LEENHVAMVIIDFISTLRHLSTTNLSTSKIAYLTVWNPPFMPYSTYRALPLESLYELLTSSVRDMLAAYDSKQNNEIAFKTMKKQVEVIIELIAEKRGEGERKN